ncbi:polysaccharide biosynthesis tyrosine autokinase [Pengzhenrongella sicca]|uniref:non-specific protein-tyrosine kinase n=1 Tax=Pengzhenrongella sicca TaxID=2819238 RepID=A0A8A4ZAF1_9MICO|nr:polysaccharide biosynthesis tyrosine autokinase [Pengzhenrongella sicca]QTE28902.1 polysaccharide biosynthesis tyrosine autokinase [Pengzhenrongella sicca]
MELRDFLHVLRLHWVTIAVMTVLGAGAWSGYAALQTPQYRAQTTVLVATAFGDSVSDLNQGSSFSERQAQTYAEVARSPLVLEPVIQKLGLDTTARALRGRVTAAVQASTALIDISVTDSSGQQAAGLADAVSVQLAAAVGQLSPPTVDDTQSVVVTVISPATVPGAPFAPDLQQAVGMGALLGLILALGWALVRTSLDTKVRAESDLRRVTESSLLGTITFDPTTSGKDRRVIAATLTRRAEEYRQLRTNLQFIDAAHRPHSIVVTSSRDTEGKSVTAINLAHALADSGVRICLVDADLRRPSVADYLELEGSAGLTTVLIGRATLDDVIQVPGQSGLHVLTSGQIPPNPSELVSSERMAQVLDELKSRYEMVLFDSPPLLPVTDAAVLGKLTEGVLLVAGAGIVTRDQLKDSIEMLSTVGARLFGLVLNRAPRRDGGSRTYSYHPAVVELDGAAAPDDAPITAEASASTPEASAPEAPAPEPQLAGDPPPVPALETGQSPALSDGFTALDGGDDPLTQTSADPTTRRSSRADR